MAELEEKGNSAKARRGEVYLFSIFFGLPLGFLGFYSFVCFFFYIVLVVKFVFSCYRVLTGLLVSTCRVCKVSVFF